MGFEPRMRGRRFRRSPAKKKSSRDRREQQEAPTFFEEEHQIEPSQIRSSTLNALEHLGSQRFPLPPYSEHLQRWMKDVSSLMSDFENQLPQAANQQYKENVAKILSDLQLALNERTRAETNASSKLAEGQRRLAAYQSELSKLDQDYKTRTHEMRKRHEQSSDRLRTEIQRLDEERLRILHTKPTLIQRLLRRSDGDLEKKTNALRSRKNALGDRKDALRQDLEQFRVEYESKRKEITEQLKIMRKKLKDSGDNKVDDGVQLRDVACRNLRQEVEMAVDGLLEQKDSSGAQREL
jgi:predicted  nucleic acid-binding Zn-ribbon protein